MPFRECLIVGFYDYPFADYVGMLRAMGTDSGVYQDLSLAFVEHEGRPMRALDILTHFHYEGRPAPERAFHNADFLWPVVAYLTTLAYAARIRARPPGARRGCRARLGSSLSPASRREFAAPGRSGAAR